VNILRRLFGGSRGSEEAYGSPGPSGHSPLLPDHRNLFIERVHGHRQRMTSAGPVYARFLEEYLSDQVVEMLAAVASDKMALTEADGDEHSMMLAKTPVCYVICTIPVRIRDGASWFERRYGGYTKVLEHCWNSDVYRSARSEVLCHITYGHAHSETWVNITLSPLNSARFSFKPVLAIDLLSGAERRMTRTGEPHQKEVERKRVMAICDICGQSITSAEVVIIPPATVVKATKNGYVPSKLPAAWYSQCKALGITVGSHWKTVVDGNSGVDWGMCANCASDLTSHGAAREGLDRPGSPEGARTCTRFSKTVNIVKQADEYVCDASLPIKGNPDPCAEPFCVHNIMMATIAKLALKAKGVSVDVMSDAELRQKLLELGMKDYAASKSE